MYSTMDATMGNSDTSSVLTTLLTLKTDANTFFVPMFVERVHPCSKFTDTFDNRWTELHLNVYFYVDDAAVPGNN